MNPSTSSWSISRKQQPILHPSLSTPSLCGGRTTAAECCGGMTAGCAVLWCCGPCSVVNLVVLVVYKIPRGLCRRVRRKRLERKELIKVGSKQFAVHPLESKDEYGLDKLASMIDLMEDEEEEDEEEDEALIALEKEMWNRFDSGGFWRSLSQAETTPSSRSD
ncbi:hypothetical protein V5N11_024737 [Cardamine amara subsp. amara]|uniref:Uncharacterized protein n=1 Tax=Cardamine amara subsp. amara TaxID=228776 RepID=A0ABD0ZQN6_CARAN